MKTLTSIALVALLAIACMGAMDLPNGHTFSTGTSTVERTFVKEMYGLTVYAFDAAVTVVLLPDTDLDPQAECDSLPVPAGMACTWEGLDRYGITGFRVIRPSATGWAYNAW